MSTPMNVRMFGWIRSATHTPMMARSGNMQMVPMKPLKVILKTHSVVHADPRPQAAHRPPPAAAGPLPGRPGKEPGNSRAAEKAGGAGLTVPALGRGGAPPEDPPNRAGRAQRQY